MRPALLLLVLPLVACKGSNPERDVVGTWGSPQQKVEFAADKTFKGTAGPMSVSGTWSITGRDVTLAPKTINGRPVAELKAQLQRSLSAVPAARRRQAEAMVRDLDKPNSATLSDDGKTLTSKGGGAEAPLTKQ